MQSMHVIVLGESKIQFLTLQDGWIYGLNCLSWSDSLEALLMSLRSALDFNCFNFILCFWIMLFAKENECTLTYICMMLCNTSLATPLWTISSTSDIIKMYADTKSTSWIDLDITQENSSFCKLVLEVISLKQCSVLSKIVWAFFVIAHKPPRFRDEVNVWLSITFWSSDFPALSMEIACSLSHDLLVFASFLWSL